MLMVSVCVAAYNQERYIGQTLDGIIRQKTAFPIEILVNDDCSTDGTADILRDYQRKYPETVKPLYQETNQYSKGVGIDPTFNYPRAQGKYIALCEGDDLWTDENKLQRQVDSMEEHPGCTFAMTNATIRDAAGLRPERPFLPYREKDKNLCFDKDRRFDLGEMCGVNFAPTASFLFPKAVLERIPPEMWKRPCPHGDLKLRMFCTAAGYGVYQHERTCVYRENVIQGTMSKWAKEDSAWAFERAKSVAAMLRDVDEFSKKRYTEQVNRFRDWYLYVMLWNGPATRVLDDPELLRVYRAQPPGKRARFRLKRLARRLTRRP